MDRDKAAALGVEVDTIGRTLETLLGGRQVTRFKREGEQYDVIVQIADIDRLNPDDLQPHLRARARRRHGAAVQPGQHQGDGGAEGAEPLQPAARGDHHGAARAGLHAGRGLDLPGEDGEGSAAGTAQLDYAGQSREFKEASSSMYLTFLLALAFIYLVLAAQFESFVDPLIIMLTVPLSITGALLALRLTGGTLNIYSQIGLVTLIGLITKHGILIVEFANQLRARDSTYARP